MSSNVTLPWQVITILGPTTGTRAVRMGDSLGLGFVNNLLANLRKSRVLSTLVVTSHLHLPAHPSNNLCLSLLRPAGVCCGYAGVGMRLVHAGGPGRNWTVSDETHPYIC